MSILLVGPENLPLDKLNITDESDVSKGRFYRIHCFKKLLWITKSIVATEDTMNLTASLRNYLYDIIPITVLYTKSGSIEVKMVTYNSDSDYFDQFDSSKLWLGKPKKFKVKSDQPIKYNINYRYARNQLIDFPDIGTYKLIKDKSKYKSGDLKYICSKDNLKYEITASNIKFNHINFNVKEI